MTSPDTTSETEITRKKFIGSGGALAVGAVASVAAYLGSERKAEASGGTIPAYLDDNGASNEIFKAPYTQTFQGKAIFQNGDPWFDVRAFNAYGDGIHDDTTAITNVIAAAVSTSGTGATGNAIVYFPPGIYIVSGTYGVSPVLNASNFTLLGAGFRSSILKWGSVTNTPSNLLTLQNPRGVVIRDLGFNGVAQSIGSICAINVVRNPGLVSATTPPTGVLVERVCIGDPSQPAGTTIFGYGIAYTAASGQDTYSDNGTFRDVSIFNSVNGYYFGTANGLRHIIEGGSVQNCSSAALINVTPSSTNGGSYTVIGTRFSGNARTCYIGPVASNETNNLLGIQAGFPGAPETNFITTASGITDQSVVVAGGHAIVAANGGVTYSATQGPLEFHGFRAYSPNGFKWNFPGAGQVKFYGGLLSSGSFSYNGTLQFHGTHHDPTGAASFSPTSGSSTARLLGFGYQNHLIGATSLLPSGNYSLQSAAGTGAPTPTVTGSDLGGSITLNTGRSPGVGILLKVTLVTPMPAGAGAVKVMLSPGNSATAGVMKSIYSGPDPGNGNTPNTTTTFYLSTTVALPALTGGNNYIWNYAILG